MPTVTRYNAGEWGVGEVWQERGRLLYHELPRPDERAVSNVDTDNLTARFQAYFRGEQVDFADVRLDLDGVTPFEHEVISALRLVPYGDTVTYGELAALAGRPNAHRAAGSICARNRFAIVLPCHRVVAAGGIGGYGSLGVEYKRRLLDLERNAAR